MPSPPRPPPPHPLACESTLLPGMVSGWVPACRSEEKALAAIENITFELEAAASAIRHNTNTEIKGQVRDMPTLPYARAKGDTVAL